MITNSKQITKHFHSTEFKCKCGCGKIYIDEGLVNKLENIFSKLNASKCNISSGYRCSKHDKNVGGDGKGQHTIGYAADCIYYDKNNKIIPSKYVICAAYDSDLFRGIAKINNNYTHLDIRTSGYYKGDETVSNNSVWNNPYDYFGVTKSEMAKYTGETTTTPTTTPTATSKYKVGDTVSINGVFVSSTSDKKLKPAKSKGKITKIVSGARNPYLLENGNIGWTNDSCIVSSVATVYKTVTNCDWLNLRTSPMYGSNIYKSVKSGTKVEYLGIANGWARIKYNNKVLYCGNSYLK